MLNNLPKINVRLIDNESDVEDPVDFLFKQLNCDIKEIPNNSDEYKLVDENYRNTQSRYSNNKIEKLYKIVRNGEEEKFLSGIGNRKLLWHGSPLTNIVGILSQGLRIASPDAIPSGNEKKVYL